MPNLTNDSWDATRRIAGPAFRPPPGDTTPPPASSLGRAVGRYRVERELGRGGMGVVLLAYDGDLGRPVALKFVAAHDPEALARLRLEANALANLSHPNVVRVFEIGEDAGRPFLALEFIDGPTLFQTLRDGPLDPRRAGELLRLVAAAAHAAHVAGVLHRDLKPGNVLLAPDGTPKLTDFGLAKRLDTPTGLTATNHAVGTPAYMAPEQARGEKADARTDVYGLGATLYECLTGRPPFTGPVMEVLRQVLLADPVPPRRLNPSVPRDLETITLKCLEKDLGRRYATADELVADLDRFLGGRAVTARPVGPSGRAVKWGRRNRRLSAATLTAVLAVVGGAATAGVQAVRATRARDAEAVQRQIAEERADEATAINRFLLDDLLRQASTTAQMNRGRVPDPNLTVRAALDRAAAAVGDRFADRPAVEARVRAALGDAFLGVGEFAQAADQYRQAGNSFRERLGPDDPETLAAEAAQAGALQEAGRSAEALPLWQRLTEVHRAAGGPAHPDAIRAVVQLAAAYREAGRPTDALAPLEDALQQARAAFGPDHPDTVLVAVNLASVYKALGRPADAVPLYEHGVRGNRERFGPDHPSTLTLANNLAEALSATGRGSEAVPLLEDTLRRRRQVLGPDHPDSLTAQNNLAAILLRHGKTDAALALAEEGGRQTRQRLGPDDPAALIAENNRASALIAAGRADEAVPLLEKVVPAARTTFGAAHPNTLSLVLNLGVAYAKCDRPAEAIPLLEQVLRGRKKVLGPANPQVADAQLELGVSLAAAGRPADARPVLTECLQARRTSRGPADPDTLVAAYQLAQVDARLERFAEAAAGFETVWRGLADRRPVLPLAGEAQGAFGMCLFKLGRYADAEPVLLERFHQFAAAGGAADRLARGRRLLADLYRAWGKPAEAAKWAAEAAAPPPPIR